MGTIIFHGKVSIGCGTKLLVQKGALLELGANIFIGDSVNLGCHRHVSVGDLSRIAHRCQIQESNHHFLANMTARTVGPCTRPISIGRNCWICNSTTLTAGAVVPDFCIVASNSLVNGGKKDIAEAPAGSIIGGIPAKVVASKETYRIFNHKLESKLFLWFEEHKDEKLRVKFKPHKRNDSFINKFPRLEDLPKPDKRSIREMYEDSLKEKEMSENITHLRPLEY